LPPYVASLGGSVPDGYYVTAGCIVDLGSMLSDDDGLWSVGLTSEDEANWITGGRRTILGPDGKAWTFSNRNIHDPEIVKKALTHLYIEGVALAGETCGIRRRTRTFRPDTSRRAEAPSIRVTDAHRGAPPVRRSIALARCPPLISCGDRDPDRTFGRGRDVERQPPWRPRDDPREPLGRVARSARTHQRRTARASGPRNAIVSRH
jgi:hypothetical protein